MKMSEARHRVLRVIVFPELDKSTRKKLWRLLKRHNGRVRAVAVVLELDQPEQLGGLLAAYNARALRIPPELLLPEDY